MFCITDVYVFIFYFVFVNLLHPYPGFYSYTEGATWKILDLLTDPQSQFPGHLAESIEEGCTGK